MKNLHAVSQDPGPDEGASVHHRRRWTADEKIQIVRETMIPGATVSAVARRHHIPVSLLFRWRGLMVRNGTGSTRRSRTIETAAEASALQERIKELERLLGKKTLEVEQLREKLVQLDKAEQLRALRRSAPKEEE